MLSERFDDALVLASQLHRRQVRKGAGAPYLSHLLAVAGVALEFGASEDEAIAALLHDAVEDQGGAATENLIRRRFGDVVAATVRACSDTDQTPKPPWRTRKEAYLAHLPAASPSALLVSAADKLCNARSLAADYRRLGEALWPRFNCGRDGTLWYYRQLVRAYRAAGGGPLVDEVELAVRDLFRIVGEPWPE